MIKIGKIYHTICDEQARLCADISVDGRCQTLWYGIPKGQADYLTQDRADPFLLLFTPLAMRFGHNVVSESPISARLHYQIEHCLVPTLNNVHEKFKLFTIAAPLIDMPHKNLGGVLTAFSGGVDSLYTVMKHLPPCEIPLTHLTLFNVGVFEGKDNHEKFRLACKKVEDFAKETNLSTVFLDSNFHDVMKNNINVVEDNVYLNMSGVLALQGIVSTYLYSSSFEASQYDLLRMRAQVYDGAYYEHVAFANFSTESVTVYLSGMEATDCDKIATLSEWEPSYNWLHPCFHIVMARENCGFCKKCARVMVALYAMDRLERYNKVFPVNKFYQNLPEQIATVMLHSDIDHYSEPLELLKQNGKIIPPETYSIIKRFCNGERVCDCASESIFQVLKMRKRGRAILEATNKC